MLCSRDCVNRIIDKKVDFLSFYWTILILKDLASCLIPQADFRKFFQTSPFRMFSCGKILVNFPKINQTL